MDNSWWNKDCKITNKHAFMLWVLNAIYIILITIQYLYKG